jgi:hypothetical protein
MQAARFRGMASNTETLAKLEIRAADAAFEPIRRLRVELAQSDTEARRNTK